MTRMGAAYAFFLLFKRIYMSATMEFTDGLSLVHTLTISYLEYRGKRELVEIVLLF